jgi:GAF domain-containing protein
MRKGRQPPPAPRTKADALARVAQLERQVRRLERRLAEATGRVEDAARVRARVLRAIEARNRDLSEVLTQQAVTSAVLKVISRSAFDLQPVLEILIENAVRLCDADKGLIYRPDGDVYTVAASRGHSPQWLELVNQYPIRRDRGSATGRAVLDRRTIHIPDVQLDPEYRWAEDQRSDERMHRTILAVPMLREGDVLGVIVIRRTEVQPFTDRQVELVETFADQAVIAIEKARALTALEARNAALTESLGRETATSEILRVIARSPTEVESVFDAVVANAARLCGANDVMVLLVDGDDLRATAGAGPLYRSVSLPSDFRFRLTRDSVAARAVIDRTTIHTHDLLAEPEEEFRTGRELAQRFGHRTMLAVPLLRDGVPLGVICAFRFEVRPFPDQQIALLRTFADQAVIAIENTRLFTELQARNRALTQSLDRQTATADVLRIIAQSPADLQPVLDAIAASAVRLCQASDAVIERLEGDRFYNAAHAGTQMKGLVGRPLPLTRRFPGGRAVLDRERVVIDDIQRVAEREYPDTLELLQLNTIGSVAEIPLLGESGPLGSLAVLRAEVRPFTDTEIALLETFAAQAVIAIENVRLFRALEERNRALAEALEQQTGTSEILQVISSSPTDVGPVFAAMAASARRLCRADDATIFQIDAGRLRLVAHEGAVPLGPIGQFTVPLMRGSLTGRVAMDRRTIQIADHQVEEEEYPEGTAIARRYGVRTMLGVPLLRAGEAVGVIALRRTEVRPFAERQVELLKTFADQAVIAIENVRLFRELEARNQDLGEALEQQTATAEILRVIGTSPTDVQPVFEGIARSAVGVCGALGCVVFVIEGDMARVAATHGLPPERVERFRAEFPVALAAAHDIERVVRERSIFHLADIENNPAATPQHVEIARLGGYRTRLMVPMVRGESALGLIAVTREAATPFPDRQVGLLRTFADQAVIAIDNVRLFRELGARNRDLGEALERQTATAEILRAISQAQTDVQPVFETIAESALRLFGAGGVLVWRYDGELLHLAATRGGSPGSGEAVMERWRVPRRPDATVGLLHRVVSARAIQHIADVETDSSVEPVLLQGARERGWRSTLQVPMLRGGDVLGIIGVSRAEPGAFAPADIALLQTFADQAVIAVENARLLTELQARNKDLGEALERQTATAEILRAISRAQTDVQPVFEVIADSAMRLLGAWAGGPGAARPSCRVSGRPFAPPSSWSSAGPS